MARKPLSYPRRKYLLSQKVRNLVRGSSRVAFCTLWCDEKPITLEVDVAPEIGSFCRHTVARVRRMSSHSDWVRWWSGEVGSGRLGTLSCLFSPPLSSTPPHHTVTCLTKSFPDGMKFFILTWQCTGLYEEEEDVFLSDFLVRDDAISDRAS